MARGGRAVAHDGKAENRGRAGRGRGRSAERAQAGAPGRVAAFEFAVPARMREWAAQEVAAGRLLPWFAVAYGFGIVLYFTAEREPAWWAAHWRRSMR